MPSELRSVGKTNKNWLAWQRPLMDRKTNFRLIIYSRSSTNRDNLAKIGPANCQINGLTEIVKSKKQQHII